MFEAAFKKIKAPSGPPYASQAAREVIHCPWGWWRCSSPWPPSASRTAVEQGGGPKVRHKGAVLPRHAWVVWVLFPLPQGEAPRTGFLKCHAACELIGCVSTQGDNSFVVMTNFIVTPGQKQGTCPEVNTLASFSSLSFCDLRGVWWWHWGSFPDTEGFSKNPSMAPYYNFSLVSAT